MIYKKNIYYQSHQSHHARFALANRFDTIRRSEHARTAFSRERREGCRNPLAYSQMAAVPLFTLAYRVAVSYSPTPPPDVTPRPQSESAGAVSAGVFARFADPRMVTRGYCLQSCPKLSRSPLLLHTCALLKVHRVRHFVKSIFFKKNPRKTRGIFYIICFSTGKG